MTANNNNNNDNGGDDVVFFFVSDLKIVYYNNPWSQCHGQERKKYFASLVGWLVVWLVVWFYGISTFVSYLMPNPFLYK